MWAELSDAELTWAVACHECAEALLARGRFGEAAKVLAALLEVAPSDVLAHLKLALALLAADALSSPGGSGSGGARSHVNAAQQLRVPQLLRRAVRLEPGNAHLRAAADLVLRIVAATDEAAASVAASAAASVSGGSMGKEPSGGGGIPDRLWSASETPRSEGMDACLLAMLRRP